MSAKEFKVRQTNKKSGRVYVILSKEAIMYLTDAEIKRLTIGERVETQYNKFEKID